MLQKELLAEQMSPVDDLVRAFLADDLAAVDAELPQLLQPLMAHGAAEDWHKHGSFKDHLIGVYRILKLWRQPRDVCVCGLFHSVYSNEYVDLALFDGRTGRDGLRAVVGGAAEELIHLFCTMPRTAFAVELLRRDDIPPDGLTLRDETGRAVTLSPRQVGIFLVVTLADLVEQWFSWQDDTMAGYPFTGMVAAAPHWSSALWPGPLRPSTVCLSLLSRLARHLPALPVTTPPVFDRCTGLLSKDDEATAVALYWQVVLQNGPLLSPEQAKGVLRAAIAHNPWVGEPHLALAQLALTEGDFPTAEMHAEKGLVLLVDWGTPWDKRIAWSGWIAWARLLLDRARKRRWPATLREHNNLGLVVEG